MSILENRTAPLRFQKGAVYSLNRNMYWFMKLDKESQEEIRFILNSTIQIIDFWKANGKTIFGR